MKGTFTKILLLSCLVLLLCNCKRQRCRDGILNQNETTTDCGGPCKSCGTCSDGIKNQNETGTDCGGVCLRCPSCNDGIKNQDETSVDCGGVCGACPILFPFNSPNFDLNVLRLLENDTNVFFTQASMYAQIPESTNLLIKLTNLNSESATSWRINSQYNIGWTVSSPTLNTQTFSATGPLTPLLRFELITQNNTATILIEYYVNNATKPEFTKIFKCKIF